MLSRLRDAEIKTFRTDLQGDILFESDGKQVIVTVSRNKDADVFGGIGKTSTRKETEPAPAAPAETGRDYVANKNTKNSITQPATVPDRSKPPTAGISTAPGKS